MSHNRNVIPANDATFEAEVLRSKVPVLVEFGARWCGPCRALEPIVERIADEQVGRLKVVAVDVDDAPDTAARYGIRGAPTVMVFVGGERRAQSLGLVPRDRLLKLLDGVAASSPSPATG